MITRVWRGAVPAEKADAYLRLMREVALPDYRATRGNRGAWCLTRTENRIVHFEMLTFWDDIEAIKRFAGEDYEGAKYYDFDGDYLIEKRPKVQHYETYDR
ncbi:MAG: antibiotic biosynthesis monooxygenase [Steroidobacter sp.]